MKYLVQSLLLREYKYELVSYVNISSKLNEEGAQNCIGQLQDLRCWCFEVGYRGKKHNIKNVLEKYPD
jgi:hypothetical protein